MNFAGSEKYRTGTFAFPDRRPRDSFALDGGWTLGTQHVTPTGEPARLRLDYRAKEVRMALTVTVSPGVQACSFTFG